MATVTGRASDIAGRSLHGYQLQIIFTPSSPSARGASVYAAREIVISPDENGFFAVSLTATFGDWYYTVSLRYLDPAGNFIYHDFLPPKLYVPAQGGAIGDLFAGSGSTDLIPDGPVYAPADFGWQDSPLLGRMFRSGGQFITTLDAATYKLTGGATYYVDGVNGLDTNAGTQASPLKTIKAAHDKADVQTIMVRATGLYTRALQMNGFPITKSINIIGYGGTPTISNSDVLTWSLAAGTTKTYQATRAGVGNVADVLTGIPGTRYVKKTSIAEVEAAAGSWYADATYVYVRTNNDRIPDVHVLALLAGGGPILATGNFNIYLENLVVLGGQSTIDIRSTTSGVGPRIVAKNVRAGYSTVANVYNVLGANLAIFQNCDAFGAAVDGFNYKVFNSIIPKAIEIDCQGYSNGRDTSSDNGSTAHDGVHIIRLNGRYFNNRHSNVADVNTGTESWNLGCAAWGSELEDAWAILTDSPKAWFDTCTGQLSVHGLTVGAGATVRVRQSSFSSINGTVTEY